VVSLVRLHMTQIVAEKKTVRRWMGRLGEDTLSRLLLLQQADMGSKGTGIDPDGDDLSRINTLMDEIRAENACLTLRDLAVKGNDLMALGLQGREVGAMLQYLLEQVMDEKLDNEKTALLAAVKNKIHG
jgi:tRNA nucleotidyltransferase (CCA-adding enzyme)